jgi:hypothetical protein
VSPLEMKANELSAELKADAVWIITLTHISEDETKVDIGCSASGDTIEMLPEAIGVAAARMKRRLKTGSHVTRMSGLQ